MFYKPLLILIKFSLSSSFSNKLNQSQISTAKSINAAPCAVIMLPSLTTLSNTKLSLGKGSSSPYLYTYSSFHSTIGVVYFTSFNTPDFARASVPAPHIPPISFPWEF